MKKLFKKSKEMQKKAKEEGRKERIEYNPGNIHMPLRIDPSPTLSMCRVEEFLAYIKINVKQRMLDHMLETSELTNGNSSIISISSEDEDEEYPENYLENQAKKLT